jgi:crotonobetainyl-CoA:carnitine CoA-transferase CaiB-like acyl-CoA transferase
MTAPGPGAAAGPEAGVGPGEPLLAGLRVVDLTNGIAGPVATLLLAEAGADVVKVERPGNPDRRQPGFSTWNRSKRSVVAAGDGSIDELLAGADVVVHEMGPAAAHQAGLDDATLAIRHPRLIVCSVLGWPANHPDADRPPDELLTMARLGVLDEQFAMRRDGPVFVRFPLGSWGAAYLAAIGVVARLWVRDRTGRGGAAHTSLAQGALVPLGMLWSRVGRPTAGFTSIGGLSKTARGSQATVFECGDGLWIHLMGNPALSPGVAERLAAGDELAALLRTRPRDEWLAEFWAHDVPVQPALAFGAVLDDEQARTNGYVVEVDDLELGRVTMPGNPLSTTPPCLVRGPAPELGADGDTATLAAEWHTPPVAVPPSPSGEGGLRWPLDGVKVLDLGAFLAGPYAPMLLADLGAEVVKVESTGGDGMRPVEWAFAGCQRGKRSVALDLKSPAARPALEALVRWADVVHLNLRMPAARRLGLGADHILAVNPRAVYCHTSSYGPIGDRADWPGFDQLFQALCGWEVLGAGEGNPPMWHRFGFMDHQCALASVVAVLLALRRRDATGEGQVVAASLLGSGLLTTGEAVRRADGTLTPVSRLDADQTGISPGRRIIACRDGWVAVAASDEAEGTPPVELPLGAAVLDRTVDELLAGCDSAGVPAERVREDQRDAFLDGEGNLAAGLVARYEHPDWGLLEQPGSMWWFDDLALRIERPPPLLGEHTATVLAEVGVGADEVAALVAAGAAVARDLDPA